MSRPRRFSRVLIPAVFCIVSAISTVVFAETEYDRPPAPLLDAIEEGINNALTAAAQGDANPEDHIVAKFNPMVIYTVADAIATLPRRQTLLDLEAMVEIADAARTDKQVGAPPNFLGSTTIVEKAGIPRLLALAIEGGAVQSDTSGTSITMATTPYAIWAMFVGDSHANYRKYNWLARLGLGVTFPTNVDLSGDISSKDLNQITATLRVLGDRSGRSKKFNDAYAARVRPMMDQVAAKESGNISVLSDIPGFRDRIRPLRQDIKSHVRVYLLTSGSKKDNVKREELRDAILTMLKKSIYNPIKDNQIVVPDAAKAKINDEIIPDVAEVNRLLREARVITDELVKELDKTPLFTIGYSFQRADSITDVSEIKLLYDQPIAGNTLLANAFVSFNHDPVDSLGQNTVRDYGAALSWQKRVRNAITGNFSDQDIKPITISLDLRLTRLEEQNDAMVAGQLRLSVPIAKGFELPIGFTWASRTRSIDDADFRASIGLSLDADALAALSQLQQL
jgi:hypothetical protein